MSEPDDTKPKSSFGRGGFRRTSQPKLAPDAAQRQGAVTRLALDILPTKEEAIAYLNFEHKELGGRPLALATASLDGLRQVESDLATRGSKTAMREM